MRFWSILGIFAVLSLSAQADVLYDNITGPVNTQNSVTIYGNGPLYNSFSTGTSTEQLSNLEVLLGFPVPDPNISIDVTLFNDIGNTPDLLSPTSLGTIAFSGAGVYTVALTNNPVLTATTRYWISLSTTETTGDPLSDPGWSFAASTDGSSVLGVSNEYTQIGSNPSLQNSSSGIAFQMIVDGTAVPEPTSFIPFAAMLGLVGLVAVDRRRRQAQE